LLRIREEVKKRFHAGFNAARRELNAEAPGEESFAVEIKPGVLGAVLAAQRSGWRSREGILPGGLRIAQSLLPTPMATLQRLIHTLPERLVHRHADPLFRALGRRVRTKGGP
jgi:hypothetical protein